MTLTSTRRAFVCALFVSIIGILALASVALAQPADASTKSLPDLLGPWFGLAAVIISVGGSIYAWLTSRSKDNANNLADLKKDLAEDLSEMNSRLNGQGSRIQAIESEIKNLPDRDAAHSLELSMTKLSGRLDALDERLRPVDAISNRLQEFLLEQARSK